MYRVDKKVKFSECFKCILKNIGATIMGAKPAELRNIYLDKSFNIWDKCKEKIKSYNQVEIIEVDSNQERKKVLFYHKFALNEYLQKKENLEFLKGIGYPQEYTLDSYLYLLVDRLRGDNFPHEIGIFFGYPLKDVLGFMGHSDLECTLIREWKVYGDKEESLLQKSRFDRARRFFNKLLEDDLVAV